MKERKQFVEAVLRHDESVAETCRRFGISRKSGYKWLKRFAEEGGHEGLDVLLEDRSRRPRRSPKAIDAELEAAIVGVRRDRPRWGPKKLRATFARRYPDFELPSESTFAAVLKRNGLIKPRRRRSKTTPYGAPLAHATHPNALWSIDFKGDFAIGKTRCYPLTITDAYSRYIIACVALTSTRTTPTRKALERVFYEYGLPEAIRTDNGSPFSSKGLAGLSLLSVWWHKLGIRHERIEPGHPEQNGRHERMHCDLKAETQRSPAKSIAAQQRLFDQFRARFNFERPHEALGQRTPLEFYEVSRRPLPTPRWGRDFEYDADVETVRVSKLGYAPTQRGTFFASTTLQHQLLAIDWTAVDHARVMFGGLLLGELHRVRRSRRLRFVPVQKVSPISPDKPVTHVPR
jgi:transposase InsO family protein